MAGGAEGLGGGGAGGPSAKGLSSLAQSSRASGGPMMRSDPRPPPRPTQEDIDAQAEIDYQNDMANAEEDENLDHGAIEDYDSAESHNYNCTSPKCNFLFGLEGPPSPLRWRALAPPRPSAPGLLNGGALRPSLQVMSTHNQ
ncbi:hypothetical protein GGX14DRAFT_395732 [Mycena pura]|uniref:Uncharacterized protein n=1 Tax=Mycena pura TaxID=153505 RepID=A0AAD6VC21_9AGAR|nr:hypothetical protein GGX14DRAFT_395732 [Mycena pura]